eukprot:403374016
MSASKATTFNPGGFDMERIEDGVMHQELKDSLLCGICLELLRDPMECDNCRKLFCKVCIQRWGKNCPFQCPGILRVRPSSHVIHEFLKIIRVNCHQCEELVNFTTIEEHEEWCKKLKCANKQCQTILEYRSRKEFKVKDKSIQVCDNVCYEMYLLQQAFKKQDPEHILKYIDEYLTEEEEKESALELKKREEESQRTKSRDQIDLMRKMDDLNIQRDIVGVVISQFTWDRTTLPKEVKMSDDLRTLSLVEDDYIFRTVYADIELTEGIYYWELIGDSKCEHELKVGVSGQKQVNQKAAFSDYEYGWAYFGVGQLRHNSNSIGPRYGKPFKKYGILGVFLNMNKGTLAFALDGQYFGVAFEDEGLKQGPLYPAVSLLHSAGCILATGKAPPQYFFE